MAAIIPSPFIADWIPRAARVVRVPPFGQTRRAALDIAMGRGRHAVLLARAGFCTYGVDIHLTAVRDARDRVASEGEALLGWCADLTQHPLPPRRFDLVVVTRYLQRDLFPSIRETLTRGGVVLYETFTSLQRGHGTGPTCADHLLEPGELRRYFTGVIGFDELFYEEVSEPEALARIVARAISRS